MKLRDKEFIELKNMAIEVEQMEYRESSLCGLEVWEKRKQTINKVSNFNCGEKILQATKNNI